MECEFASAQYAHNQRDFAAGYTGFALVATGIPSNGFDPDSDNTDSGDTVAGDHVAESGRSRCDRFSGSAADSTAANHAAATITGAAAKRFDFDSSATATCKDISSTTVADGADRFEFST